MPERSSPTRLPGSEVVLVCGCTGPVVRRVRVHVGSIFDVVRATEVDLAMDSWSKATVDTQGARVRQVAACAACPIVKAARWLDVRRI